jgi:hypothetical protein
VEETREVKIIKANVAELNKQQKNLVIDPNRPETLETARKINMAKTELLGQIQRIPEKNPTPIKRTQSNTGLGKTNSTAVTNVQPIKTIVGEVTPGVSKIQKSISTKPQQLATILPQASSIVPIVIPTKQSELDEGLSKVNNVLQNLVQTSRTQNTLLEELNDLIESTGDEEDKKLLQDIRDKYFSLVSERIKGKIKNKYISQ